MELFDLTQTALERALEGAALRQRILSSNIANANTPGFRRLDVDFHGALASALERDSSPSELRELTFSAEPDASGPTRADGSNVDIEREMAALAENSLEYQGIISVMRARLRMLEAAITGRA